jgi:hypothetical protein
MPGTPGPNIGKTQSGASTKSQLVGSGSSSAGASKQPTPKKPVGNWSSPISYPSDLKENHADYVQFKFYDYLAPYQGATAGGGKGYVNNYNGPFAKGVLGEGGLSPANQYPVISLYLPEDLSTSYAATWGGRQFGPLAGLGLSAAGAVMNAGDEGAAKREAEHFAQQVPGMVQGAIPYIGARLVSEAMNRIPGMGGNVQANDILASTRGEILNPNTEVLYQGPELRTFNLNFKMVARNKPESVAIKTICDTFKKASLPAGKSNTPNLIGVPKIVKVTFKHKSADHPYLTQYKCAAIGNVSINYTPDGAWASYVTGAPVAVTLGLQFAELKLVYSEDIDEGF